MKSAIAFCAALAAAVTLSAQLERFSADIKLLDVSGRPSITPPGPLDADVSLEPPAGTRFEPGGRASDSLSYQSAIQLDTSKDVVGVASHYATQIVANGWRNEGRVADGADMVAIYFAGTTKAGRPLTAVLALTKLSHSRIDVGLRILRHQPVLVQYGAPSGSPAAAEQRRKVLADAKTKFPNIPTGVFEVLFFATVTATRGEPYSVLTRVPEAFPVETLPAEATVTVAAESKSVTTIVATAPAFEMTSITRHMLSLASAGWLSRGAVLGGFSSLRAVSTQVCRGPQRAQVSFLPREPSGVYVRVSVEQIAPCPARPYLPFADVALPLLFSPPTTMFSGGAGGGGGHDTHHSETRLVTKYTVPQLASHYSDMLARSGWPVTGQASDSQVTIQRAVTKTSKEQPLSGILVLTKIPGSDSVDAWFRVVRHSPSMPR